MMGVWWVKPLLIGLICLMLFAAGWKEGANHAEYKCLQAASKEAEAKAADELKAQGVEMAYELRIKDLEFSAREQPARVVRLCNNPVQVPPAAGKPDGAGTDRSVGEAGPDIGPGLRDYAIDYRKCAERLNALQEWVGTVASSKGR